MYNYGKWYLINGVKQYIHIISTDLNNPILVYLHGGPGDAALPLVEHFNSDISQKYTLVIWEQRGSGKSYYKFFDDEKLTLDDFIADLKELIKFLLIDYKKDKVCLLAHSWGSIIGLKFITLYPELVYYYVGVGQVINTQKMYKLSKEYITNHLENSIKRDKISNLDITFTQKQWYSDLMLLTDCLIKQGVSLYNKKSYFSLYKYFIFSHNYSIYDCFNRIKGSKQSIIKLWHEVVKIDFSNYNEFKIPVIFIEGEHDYHVSSEIVLNFFNKLTSPGLFYLMKNTAHFPQWTRAETFNEIINSLEISQLSNSNKIISI